MHATSQNRGALLIAAVSGRALAAAARRAGYRPLVADLFRDDDTVALSGRAARAPGDLQSGFDIHGLVETLAGLADGEAPVALICGSGFESRPEQVTALGTKFALAGNDAAAIRRAKDPDGLAQACADFAIPHPEHAWKKPSDSANWLAKTAGGAGGSHVRRASDDGFAPGRYYQRFIDGRSISALFVADGRGARVVGFSRQWRSPAQGAPYRYGGAARLRRFPARHSGRIERWLDALSGRLGLKGLCSADFIVAGEILYLVEINPRPGATLDLFDTMDAPLIEAHLRAARGEAFSLPRFADSMASMIAYIDRPLASFPALRWPDWTADRQALGTRLAAGDPLCTVFARDRSAGAAELRVRAKVRAMHDLVRESVS